MADRLRFEPAVSRRPSLSRRRESRDARRVCRLGVERLERRDLLAANFAEFVDPNPSPGNGFGSHVVPLSTGNVVITAPRDDAGGTDAGAVYLFNGATGALVSTLHGSSAYDLVGYGGVTVLTNGNYAVSSPSWGTARGAVTWASGISGVSGAVSASNSLVGGTPAAGSDQGDQVGQYVVALANGNYLVLSYEWNNGTAVDAGAVTWGSGEGGVSGVVSAANSLVGSVTNDSVGINGVTELANGNYLVSSRNQGSGAVTWGSGTTGISGVVSASNSLVGSSSASPVGGGGLITELANGNYLVSSPNWDNGANVDAGALTFGNGESGVAGVVGPANSLVDCSSHGITGSYITVRPLADGNYLVFTPGWDNGAVADAGAVTWGSGASGVAGAVGPSISLVGSHTNNRVGDGDVTELPSGNFLIHSQSWNDRRGAVTWASGTSGVAGVVSADNSLVGDTPWDFVGGNVHEGVTVLSNGNYVISSPQWDNGAAVDAGAVTWGSGTSGVSGVVSAANSLVGSTALDMVGALNSPFGSVGGAVTALANGNYVVSSPGWDNGADDDAGAVTWASGETGIAGVIDASNSLVGVMPGNGVGGAGVTALASGNYVINSPAWHDGSEMQYGAVTWASGASGIVGTVSESNSLVGLWEGGSAYYHSPIVAPLANGNYVVNSPHWFNSSAAAYAGAVTWGSGTSGVTGVVSAANSLVGNYSGVGGGGITALANGNYVVSSPYWGDGAAYYEAGAVTWGDGATGVSGAVSAANSLIDTGGAIHGGSDLSVVELTNGNFVVLSPQRRNGAASDAGAVIWASGTSGMTGVVSAANSLLGSHRGDRVGRDGITELPNGNYLIHSTQWNSRRGAVTWASGASAVSGVVSDLNSLVGTTPFDDLGATYAVGGVSVLASGNYLVRSPNWDNGAATDAGAVTWGSGESGIAGAVGAENSLVGSTQNDKVGRQGIIELANGNYVVQNAEWDHGAVADVGAVTWGSGASGVAGAVSASNSLIGSTAGDRLGENGSGAQIIALANGNYVVRSSFWDNGSAVDAGAVAWGSGVGGVRGPVNALNSAVGLIASSPISIMQDDSNDTLVVRIGDRILVGSQTVGFTAVRAGSTEWSADFTEHVDPALGLGYIIPPADAPLPWTNLNRLSVTFTNALEKAGGGTLTADDFDLRGVNQADYNPLVTGFAYDPVSRTATFTLSQPIEADSLRVHIAGSGVQDAAGHVQLGQYEFRFDVLPGDYGRSGLVDQLDLETWQGQFGLTDLAAGADGNADGLVDGADFLAWQRRHGELVPPPTGILTQNSAVAAAIADRAFAQLAGSGGLAPAAEFRRPLFRPGDDLPLKAVAADAAAVGGYRHMHHAAPHDQLRVDRARLESLSIARDHLLELVGDSEGRTDDALDSLGNSQYSLVRGVADASVR
ncbi:MAG: hypothetical protein DCC67_02470 [Planctomycetota bacterium]|nr:MAG: hypothetical protein DCC67_02470 [Planctomycetota bacterium]